MNSRERWLAVLEGRTPDRVPTDFWSTPEFLDKLRTALGCANDEEVWQKLHIDRPLSLEPRWKIAHHPDDPQADLWGIRYEQIHYATGVYAEPVHHPLAHVTDVKQVHAFRWPSTDWYDYAAISEAIDRADGRRVVVAGQFEPMLLYGYLRGLEKSYEDLLLDTDIADAILGHLFDFHCEHLRLIYEAGRGRIDVSYLAEDLGGQTGPLLSLDLYKRFILPNQKKMADLMRRHRVHILYHTDGAARPFLPYLVDEVGIEMLNPIQWRCPGMEREGLVRDFGVKIAFHGAMDNQQTLPFGTVDDVIAEVKDNLDIFGGSRWVCAPCHNIQAVTPVENVLALYETIHELGAG